MALSTDYDCWHEEQDERRSTLNSSTFLRRNVEKLEADRPGDLAVRLPLSGAVPVREALKYAIITDRKRSRRRRARASASG